MQPDSLPRYEYSAGGELGRIEWNYTKFLIDRDGRPVRRYRPGFDPLVFEGDVHAPCVLPVIIYEVSVGSRTAQ